VDLRECPQHHDPASLAEEVEPVDVVGIVDVLEVRLVENAEDVSRQPVEEGEQVLASVRRSGRVVRIADVDELRPRPDRGEEAVEVIGVVAERNASRLGAELRGSENVAREGRPAADDLVARVERRLREQVDDPVGASADHELLEGDPVSLGELRPERPDAAVRVAVELERRTRHRLERPRERRVRALVRGKLDDVLQPELPLHRLDRLARLVRHEAVDRGAEEACHLRALLIAALLVALLAPVRQLAADGLRLPARDDLPHLQREDADDGVTPVYDAHSLLLSDCEQTYAGAAARGLRFGMWMARPSATSPASLIASDSVGCGAMPSATVSTVDSASIATTPASTMSVTC